MVFFTDQTCFASSGEQCFRSRYLCSLEIPLSLFFHTLYLYQKQTKKKNCSFCYLVFALVHTALQEYFEYCTVLLCMCTEKVRICVFKLVKPLKGQHFYSLTTTRLTSYKIMMRQYVLTTIVSLQCGKGFTCSTD